MMVVVMLLCAVGALTPAPADLLMVAAEDSGEEGEQWVDRGLLLAHPPPEQRGAARPHARTPRLPPSPLQRALHPGAQVTPRDQPCGTTLHPSTLPTPTHPCASATLSGGFTLLAMPGRDAVLTHAHAALASSVRVQKRVEVLEHRLTTGLESMPLLKRWRPALVVITLDNFLHIFDLPAEVRARRGSGFFSSILLFHAPHHINKARVQACSRLLMLLLL